MDYLTQFFANLPTIFMGWVLPILFVLTLVVFFHELGHFLVARLFNVNVEAFSIGFGKEIFGFNDNKNTRWKFCWLPLGGYVKFKDDSGAASTPDHEVLETMSPEEKKGAFHLKPLWQKALIVVAGPIASFILGIIIFTGIKYYNTEQGPSTLIKQVIADSVAQKAGLQAGDIITHIDGTQTKFFADIFRIISLGANDPLSLTVKRGAETLTIPLMPEVKMVDNGFGKKISVGRIGVASSDDRSTWIIQNHTFTSAFLGAVNQTKFIITSTLNYIGKIFTGRESIDKLNGPIGIGKIVNQFSEMGIVSTLYIAGLLSVSIGLFNLFPIPLLDGGHLMFYAIEAVRGRPVSEQFMEYSFRIGLALLVGLMILATTNDI